MVVTATGAPLAVEEAGVAADVFTAKDFEPARGAFVQDLLRDVPGLNVVQTGSNGGLTIGVRARRRIGLGPGAARRHSGHRAGRIARLRAPDVRRTRSDGSDPRAGERAVRSRGVERGDPDVHRSAAIPRLRKPHGTLAYERGSFSTDHWTAALNGGFANRLDYAFTSDQFRSTGEFPNDAYRITSGTGEYRISL